ncbi:DNA-binding protein [Brucella intermedia]|uniref:DNA-binding protein n=1 Tax=Brucella intermedia TaxID=94625 RepID=UPI00163CFC05|nr:MULTISPECIES: DNA-binding protein [Brucella/Ochrobactrum group]MBC2887300.1 DNA-binding protein [Ochrobactrum sp. CM-21-5]WLF99130.1 DNA-binding protein [Brucella intermedia]
MTHGEDKADLLYGARPIADFLGMTEKQARHRIDDGHIPTFRIGGTICSRKSTLTKWLDEMEAQEARK